MKIIKRNGAEVPFDITKIITAVTKASDSVSGQSRLTKDQITQIAAAVTDQCQALNRAVSVEEVQDMVENQLMDIKAHDVARHYITYRYVQSLKRQTNTTDERILSLIECQNEEVKQENANKNPTVNSVQRDYMAGEISKDLTARLLLDPEIVKAHQEGLIHFHDSDYFAQHMHNCDLVNLEDMLQNGTVITGTMIEGNLSVGDPVELMPSGQRAKVRTLQVHNHSVEQAYAGQRVAVNLAGLRRDAVVRGDTLCKPDTLRLSRMLDVRLTDLKGSHRIIESGSPVHFYHGAAAHIAKVVLLEQDTLEPGQSGFAQLRFTEPVAVKRGDRFVIRFYSPMETIGGGVVIEANPAKKKRFDERAISEMTVKEEGGHGDMIELIIKQHSDSAITAAEVAKLTGLTAEETMAEVAKLAEQGLVATFPMKKDVYLMHASYRDKVTDDMVAYLEDFHKKNPYRLGSRKAELRVRFLSKLKQNVFDEFMQRLEDSGRIKRSGEFICEGGYEIPHDEVYKQFESALTAMLDKAGFEFIRLADIQLPGIQPAMAEDLLQLLAAEGKVVLLSDDLITLPKYTDMVAAKAREILAAEGKISIAMIRDMIGTSRKSAKPLLEYLDNIRVTRRNGTESERVAY